MRRARIWKTLALVMMLLSLATGLCAAKDDGNWVQYYKENDQNVFFVNEDFVKVLEFDGRKYLELAIKCKGTKWESYIFVARPVLVTLYQQNQLLDVETGKYMMFDSSKDTKPNLDLFAKSGKGVNQGRGQALLRWVEQKYPSMVREIREHNKNHPLPNWSSGQSTTSTTSTSPNNGRNSSMGDVGGQTGSDFSQLNLGGEVRIPLRQHPEKLCTAWKNPFDDIDFEYGVSVSYVYEDGTRDNDGTLLFFDYEPETKIFTVSGANFWSMNKYDFRMRVIDHNSVYIEWLDGDEPVVNTVRPYPKETYTYRSLTDMERSLIHGEQQAGFVSEHGIHSVKYFYRDGSSDEDDVVEGYIWDWGISQIIAVEAAITLTEQGIMPDYPDADSCIYKHANANMEMGWVPDDNPAVSYQIIK